jgi:nucleoside-diphosphate kinase
MALEKENAIQDWRDLMGATNPLKAAPGTLRRMFGKSIAANATHGSDAPETAQEELKFFFPNL